ncbi:MAG: 30S ribosomal protein S6e [Candidatus Nanoarchaeia archaeon]
MAEFKLTINDPKTGKSYSKAVDTTAFKNKKIGDVVEGDGLGLKGYKLEITGGSDNSGFPLRKDLEGIAKKRALLIKGPGKRTRIGIRTRKTVRGNAITLSTVQVNLKVKEYGPKSLEEIFGVKKEEKVEEAKAE